MDNVEIYLIEFIVVVVLFWLAWFVYDANR